MWVVESTLRRARLHHPAPARSRRSRRGSPPRSRSRAANDNALWYLDATANKIARLAQPARRLGGGQPGVFDAARVVLAADVTAASTGDAVFVGAGAGCGSELRRRVGAARRGTAGRRGALRRRRVVGRRAQQAHRPPLVATSTEWALPRASVRRSTSRSSPTAPSGTRRPDRIGRFAEDTGTPVRRVRRAAAARRAPVRRVRRVRPVRRVRGRARRAAGPQGATGPQAGGPAPGGRVRTVHKGDPGASCSAPRCRRSQGPAGATGTSRRDPAPPVPRARAARPARRPRSRRLSCRLSGAKVTCRVAQERPAARAAAAAAGATRAAARACACASAAPARSTRPAAAPPPVGAPTSVCTLCAGSRIPGKYTLVVRREEDGGPCASR